MRRSALVSSFLHLIIPIASAVSLTDFQKLTVKVRESCEVSYDRTIPSCTVDDFKPDATCSSGCVSGLNQIASGVLESCGGTVVGSSTLLGRIFSGDIISSLCPNNGQSSSPTQKQSTDAAPATTAKTDAPGPIAKTSSAQSSAALSSSAVSSPSSAAAQSSSTATTESGSTAAAGASSASSSTSSSAASQTSPSQAQSGNGRSGMTVQQQQIAAIANSGGGSPFDIIGYSAASHPSQRDLVAITLGVVLLVIGYLMR